VPTLSQAPRILFVPVSGEYGMGEYARCLAIARAAVRRWQGAAIRFVLSRKAAYAADTPYPATLLASSPTFHSSAVIALLDDWRPDVAIFDNAGRTAQLRAARRVGSRVVYISSRARQRRRAFRWSWMQLIDEHWIAYPEFIAGSLGFFERLKLRMAGRPMVRYLDVMLSREAPAPGNSILARAGCEPGSFVLVVPGGGTGHPDMAGAAAQFFAAAHLLAARGVATVYVGPYEAGADAAWNDGRSPPNLRRLGPLSQSDLAELMRSARLIIANGGSTLLQAIFCGGACVAVPIAGDQAERTRRCVAAGVTVAARPKASSIVQAADQLLLNEPLRAALAKRAAALGLADGVDVAIRAIAAFVEPPQPASPQ
jgi:spore coat polysaccharide biosynthesis predicted glycosyltransferase SpsG